MFEKVMPKYVNSKNIIFLVVAIFFIKFIISMVDIAIMFFATFVIACSLDPLITKLQKHFPNLKRTNACAIILCSLVLALCALFIPILVIGGNEIKSFADSFPQYMDSLKNFGYKNNFLSSAAIARIDLNGIISSASNLSSKIIGETLNLGMNLGSAFVYLIISMLVIYYFMADKDNIKATVLKMFPPRMRRRTSEIYDNISKKIGGYVVAQIVTMASVGIIVTLGLLILRIDYALLLGAISCIFDIIPVVGPAIAFLVCMVAVYKYGSVTLICTALIFMAAQLIENNFVRPYTFSKMLNLHPLIIYLFLLIAAKYMGIVGVVFAPAIAATFVVLIEELYMKSLE